MKREAHDEELAAKASARLDDEELAAQLAARLDASLTDLDPGTLSRLRRARLAAVATSGGRRGRLFLPYWLTPGRLSFAAVALLAVSLFVVVPARGPGRVLPEDLEIMTAPEQVDLLQDLDFYRWLAVSGELPASPRQP